jgi:azurin
MSDHAHAPETSGSSFWSLFNILFGLGLTAFAGYFGVAFVVGGINASIKKHSPVVAVEATPAAAAASTGNTVELTLKTDPVNPLAFATKEFKVKAGDKVKLTFDNSSPLQHNVVIGKLGQVAQLTKAANDSVADPKGMARGFIPEDPCVLVATKLVNGGAKETIEFTAESAGDYPFICAFPGHTAMMNGVIKAE